MRHLERHHANEAQRIAKEQREKKQSQAQAKKNSEGGQRSIAKFFAPMPPPTAAVTFTKSELHSAILKMVVYDGVALSFFSGEGFKLIGGE